MDAILTNERVNAPQDQIIDVALPEIRKKKFRFNQDDNRIVELNVSDMNIVTRIAEGYPKLNALQEKAAKLTEGVSGGDDPDKLLEDARLISDRLKDIDAEMREVIDEMFNANVSDAVAPVSDGTMYDPFEGTFRFEYVITAVMDLYEKNLQSEFNKMKRQMEKHTAKYTGRK